MQVLDIKYTGMVSRLCGSAPLSALCISKSYFFLSESTPYASRQTERAPASRFMSFCVSHAVIIKSCFPVRMRRTSSANGILSLKRQRMKSSSIGRNCSRRCKSFCCCFVSANNSTFFLLSKFYYYHTITCPLSFQSNNLIRSPVPSNVLRIFSKFLT